MQIEIYVRMKIGIITAMSAEYEQIAKLLSESKTFTHGYLNYVEGSLGCHTIVLAQSGIGKVNAALGAVDMIRYCQPDCMVSTGAAGGLGAEVNVMDVVVGHEIAYHDVWCGSGNEYGQVQGLPLFYPCDESLYHAAMSLSTPTTIHGGLICTGDQFVESPRQWKTITEHFPRVLATDMESAAIAQVCYLHKKPFISFRIISDTLQKENNTKQYENFWQLMAEKSFAVTKQFIMSISQKIE